METFIVRVWVPPSPPEGEGVLRGVVEHLGSGQKTTFVDDDELLAFLRRLEHEPAGARELGGAA
jgi:hypothetical protein